MSGELEGLIERSTSDGQRAMGWRQAMAHPIGLVLAAAAAVLWGVGGVAAQELFQHHGIRPPWLSGMRLAGAGLLLLAVFRPVWPGRHFGRLFVFGVFGMAGTQYTWFAAIAHSNVATATFIQYNAIAITAGWQMLRHQIRPTRKRLAALAAAGIGVALLILGQRGGVAALRVNPLGAALAFASAIGFAYYMLASARLVQVMGSSATTAWGLSISSVPMLIWAPPWKVHPTGSVTAVVGLTALAVAVCTAIAFSLSLAGLRRITATEAAIVSTVEPAVAGFAGAMFLGVRLLPLQYLGAGLTLAAVLLLATTDQSTRPRRPQLPGPLRHRARTAPPAKTAGGSPSAEPG